MKIKNIYAGVFQSNWKYEKNSVFYGGKDGEQLN